MVKTDHRRENVTFIIVLYVVAGVWLAIYGLNSLLLAALYLRHRNDYTHQPIDRPTRLPFVTVQLPVYNEHHVIERLIDAVAALDWPRDRLQIQLLDDSDDETTALARARVAYLRRQSVDIELLRRPDRRGYKAGALAVGLARARGEFIVIFDADFVPPADFLRHTVPPFLARPELGLVQTRWAHLNADYSPLTRAQSLALDGHFAVEQTARNRSGLLMNFNGTAGVWRRACIEAGGGWSGDTISEDLDLSYRAQLAGWDCLYLPQVAAPAELPPQLAAFKRQQFRWAKGSIQCLRKLWRLVLGRKGSIPGTTPSLLKPRQLTAVQKVAALVHLSSYLAHPLMLMLLVCSLPLFLSPREAHLPMAMAYLGFSSLGPPLVYALAQRALYPDWRRRLLYLPILVLLGTGIALNNTRAVIEALRGQGGVFARTPKFRLEGRSGRWSDSAYRLSLSWTTLGEGLLALYALATVVAAWRAGNRYAIPFMLLYAAGFGLTALLGVWQAWEARPRLSKQPFLMSQGEDGLQHATTHGQRFVGDEKTVLDHAAGVHVAYFETSLDL
jgi:cellulose synthase/poly-beta-1,6-N-acetylglucosamine synthase-like glycosyltransferase